MRRTMIDVLQAFLSYSEHYLCAHVIKDYEQIITSQGVVYQIRVENMCEATGYETIDIPLDDILIFLYLDRK